MFSCRAAWQRCGPLARRAAHRLPHEAVQRRLMSSVPGGSGENIIYAVLCGGAFVGALSYGYATVTSDQARFNERITQIQTRPKTQWEPKPWPPKSKGEDEGGEEETGGEAEAGEVAAAAGEAETIVEEAAELVAEAAEVVAEAAEVVAETAQEVESVAQEVEAIAQEVEAAAQEDAKGPEAVEEAATEPATVAAEEPESNGTTSLSEEEAVASEA